MRRQHLAHPRPPLEAQQAWATWQPLLPLLVVAAARLLELLLGPLQQQQQVGAAARREHHLLQGQQVEWGLVRQAVVPPLAVA